MTSSFSPHGPFSPSRPTAALMTRMSEMGALLDALAPSPAVLPLPAPAGENRGEAADDDLGHDFATLLCLHRSYWASARLLTALTRVQEKLTSI